MASKAYYRRQFEKDIILSRHQPPGKFPFVLVLDHLKPTFNLGKIIRTANAFSAKEVHLVGIPAFNPKPCKGTLRQTRTCQYEEFGQSYHSLKTENYTLYALEPEGDSILGQCSFPKNSAFIIGHEEFGISFQRSEFPEITRLKIPQFGPVQSLNASIAAGIVCFEYLRQHHF